MRIAPEKTTTQKLGTAALLTISFAWAAAQKIEYTPADMFWRKEEFFNERKAKIAATVWGTGYGLTLGALGAAWYGGQAWAKFRFFDDAHEWKQIDKFGHAYAGYQFSRAAIETAKWSGCGRKTVLWTASAGFWMLLPIEIFDGFMEKYGASWSDVAANAVGPAVALANEWVWGRQRVHFKVGFTPTDRPRLRPELLGKNFPQQLLKDYNGHTFWLSYSPYDLWEKWPKWLCLSAGYGAGGLLGGYGKEDPKVIAEREFRRYHLSLDVDFTRIPTRKPGLKLLFGILNAVKVPFPSLEFSRKGVGLRPLHF